MRLLSPHLRIVILPFARFPYALWAWPALIAVVSYCIWVIFNFQKNPGEMLSAAMSAIAGVLILFGIICVVGRGSGGCPICKYPMAAKLIEKYPCPTDTHTRSFLSKRIYGTVDKEHMIDVHEIGAPAMGAQVFHEYRCKVCGNEWISTGPPDDGYFNNLNNHKEYEANPPKPVINGPQWIDKLPWSIRMWISAFFVPSGFQFVLYIFLGIAIVFLGTFILSMNYPDETDYEFYHWILLLIPGFPMLILIAIMAYIERCPQCRHLAARRILKREHVSSVGLGYKASVSGTREQNISISQETRSTYILHNVCRDCGHKWTESDKG